MKNPKNPNENHNYCYFSFLSKADLRFFETINKIQENNYNSIKKFFSKKKEDRAKFIIEEYNKNKGAHEEKSNLETRIGSMLTIFEHIFSSEIFKGNIKELGKVVVIHDFENNAEIINDFFKNCITSIIDLQFEKLNNQSNTSTSVNIKIEFELLNSSSKKDLNYIYKMIYRNTSDYTSGKTIILNHSGGESISQAGTYIFATHHKEDKNIQSWVVTKENLPERLSNIPSYHKATMLEDKEKNYTKSLEYLSNASESKTYKIICQKMINYAKKGNVNVFIGGESGTGKEVLAKAFAREIIANKRKTNAEFVSVNCAAFSDSMVDSELFGVKKGAATQVDERDGLFLYANKNGGVIFLDEICELSLENQSKLLRVIQEKTIKKVGSEVAEQLSKDFIVISASHKNIWHEVAKGKFREDLAFRLTYGEVEIPNLKQRGISDIKSAALEIYNEQALTNHLKFDDIFEPGCEEALNRFNWYGNFRTLQKIIIRVYIESTRESEKPLVCLSELEKQIKSAEIRFEEMKEIRTAIADEYKITSCKLSNTQYNQKESNIPLERLDEGKEIINEVITKEVINTFNDSSKGNTCDISLSVRSYNSEPKLDITIATEIICAKILGFFLNIHKGDLEKVTKNLGYNAKSIIYSKYKNHHKYDDNVNKHYINYLEKQKLRKNKKENL